jgi:endonuclease YncB( thermonuclease family)
VTAVVWGPYRGEVDYVRDADTIYVKLLIEKDAGFDVVLDAKIYARVRLLGLNAPELATPEGKTARDFVRQLLPAGTSVTVTSVAWDKFGGRVDGHVALSDGRDLGELLIQTGHAKAWDGTGPKPI